LDAGVAAAFEIVEQALQGNGFGGVFRRRQPWAGGLKVGLDLLPRRGMFGVESQQLFQDVVAVPNGRVTEDLSAGDHLEGDAGAEA
jgi:hypothetical protein